MKALAFVLLVAAVLAAILLFTGDPCDAYWTATEQELNQMEPSYREACNAGGER